MLLEGFLFAKKCATGFALSGPLLRCALLLSMLSFGGAELRDVKQFSKFTWVVSINPEVFTPAM